MITFPSSIFTRGDIDIQEFRVYSQLVFLCKTEGETEVAVRQSVLADMCGMSRVTINRRLKSLEDKGLIVVVKRIRPDKGRDASIYILKELD